MSSLFFDTIVLKYRFLLLASSLNLIDRHFDVAWKIEQIIL